MEISTGCLSLRFRKSLIFQLFVLVTERLSKKKCTVLVVSPLKSIDEDQIKEAKSLGLLYLFGFLTFVAQGLQTLSDSVELRVIQIPIANISQNNSFATTSFRGFEKIMSRNLTYFFQILQAL